MGFRDVSLLICGTLCATLAASYPAAALERSFLEDFTTREFCDSAATTADWDTVAGELRLPTFEITELGSLNTPGTAYGVDVSGDHAYAADWSGGLSVVDVSDPAGPVLAGTCALPGNAFSLVAAGDLAFVAAQTAGLQIVDISDPESPTVVGGFDTSGSAYAVLPAGSLVYVADGDEGLVIVDVSSLASPSLVGACNTPGKAYGVALHGSYVLVADGASGVQVVDVSDPALPAIVGAFDTGGYAWAIEVSGDVAYVTDNSGGLVVLDISTLASPALLTVLPLPGDALGAELDGDRLWIGCAAAGFVEVDVTDPSDPVVTRTFNTSGSAYDVAVAGEYVLVADATPGLRVLDLRGTAGLSRLELIDHLGECTDVALAGDVAWFVDRYQGLRAVDITDPMDLVEIGDVNLPGNLCTIAIHGDHAFLGQYTGHLLTVDISVPDSPAFISSFGLPDVVHDIVLSGDLLYVACGAAGVLVVSVGNPTALSTIGSYASSGSSLGLALDGNLLAVGMSDGFDLLDVSDPTAPAHIGGYVDSGFSYYNMDLDGDLLCAGVSGTGFAGYKMFDLGNPGSPALSDMLPISGVPLDVLIQGDRVFAASSYDVRVLDVSDPTDVFTIASTAALPRGVLALAGGFLYAAGDDELATAWAFTDRFRIDLDRAFSTCVFEHDDEIAALRLATEQSGSPITWRASMDGALAEITLIPGSGFRFLDSTYRGLDLQWYAVFDYSPIWGDAGPVCTSLELEWLFDHAAVDSIVDVPGDQGGWVRIHFAASGWDTDGSTDPLLGYNVLRRIDDVQGVKGIAPDAALAKSLPPGQWEVLGYIGAWKAEHYTYLAPTLGDIGGVADPSVYCISAQTAAGEFYVSSPDSGWSVDNLAPNVPEGVTVDYTPVGNVLSWLESGDADFRYFKIYRGDAPDFVVDPGNPVHMTTAAAWTDPGGGWDVFYKVSAVDFAGNESDAAAPESLADADETPTMFHMLGVAPNPFNPCTSIRFALPETWPVDLRIYDVSGRLVRELMRDRSLASGRHEAKWDGRDDSGRMSPAGVYFFRLSAGPERAVGRMVLVK